MSDSTARDEYEGLLADTLTHWRDAIYGGILAEHVLPAVRIHAHASLQDIRKPWDVAGCFPLMPEDWALSDQYGNGVFTRLSAACTSIRGALQAIQARIDGHAAVAIARRAHESLWQTFWLSNPEISADERVRRLLVLTGRDIKEAKRLFSSTTNTLIQSKLAEHLDRIENATRSLDYQSRHGRVEYTDYYEQRANDPISASLPPEPEDADGSEFVWGMMSNLTHPNMVIDLITQSQPDFQGLMDRVQIDIVSNAVGCVCNLSTTLMEQAQMPEDKVDAVNRAFRQPYIALAKLLEMRRKPESTDP